MTRLLVSVRSAQEAAAAVAGGADVIDIKEPRHGSLGAATAPVWEAVLRRTGLLVPVSCALGELQDADSLDRARAARPHRFEYAKFGLAGCSARPDWLARWQQACALLGPRIAPVAVCYADWRSVDAPPPATVIQQAPRVGCRAVLFDTFVKDGRGLFDHLPAEQLAELLEHSRRHGLTVALAGALNEETLVRAAALQPGLVAVRGAACTAGRTGTIREDRVRRMARLLHRKMRVDAVAPQSPDRTETP